jgi:hypothetical protein
MPLVVVAKVALVLLVGSIVVLLAGHEPVRPTRLRVAALLTVLAVVAGVAGGLTNAATL